MRSWASQSISGKYSQSAGAALLPQRSTSQRSQLAPCDAAEELLGAALAQGRAADHVGRLRVEVAAGLEDLLRADVHAGRRLERLGVHVAGHVEEDRAGLHLLLEFDVALHRPQGRAGGVADGLLLRGSVLYQPLNSCSLPSAWYSLGL